MIKKLLLLISIFSSVILTAPQANAHTVLIGSDPAAGSTISQLPEQITLTFAEPLLTLKDKDINQVLVLDPMGSTITSGNNIVKGATLTNVLSPRMLMSGKFKVTFRVVAQDGHPVNGNFFFTLGKSSTKRPSKPTPKGIFHLTATATSSGIGNRPSKAAPPAILSMELDFNNKLICYSVQSSIKDVLAIHVHSMNQSSLSISDEIYLPLRPASINALKPICDAATLTNMTILYYNISHYTMVIHTKAFPDGAVAGALRLTN